MNKIYLSSLGGSGENGRNCHLVEVNNQIILFDCGVKREIVDGTVGFYPALTKDIVSRITHVFLSHCHEDHVAALPLLYHLGYTGKVYATKETLAETPGFIKKWMTFVGKKNGVLPYGEEDVEKIQFEEIKLGEQHIDYLDVEIGRTGHVLGSCFYVLKFDDKKVLYTGDMVLQSATLATDIPCSCDGAILNGAYAGKTLSQAEQYEKLLQNCNDIYNHGGSVLLPIPTKGRGIDIMLFLDEKMKDANIYVEEALINSMNALLQKKAWIKEGLNSNLTSKIIVIKNEEERKQALNASQGIYMTGDGMITTDVSQQYYEVLKVSPKNKILITGHAATGTIAAGVLDEEYRKEHQVYAQAEKIIFKVHLDDEDIYQMVKQLHAKKVVLFHANEENNTNIKNRLEKENVSVTTLLYPNKMEI